MGKKEHGHEGGAKPNQQAAVYEFLVPLPSQPGAGYYVTTTGFPAHQRRASILFPEPGACPIQLPYPTLLPTHLSNHNVPSQIQSRYYEKLHVAPFKFQEDSESASWSPHYISVTC